jgi:hypothetical protein
MKLKINLEQEMTEEELDVLYEEFDIDGENKEAQLCFLLKSVLVAQLNKDESLSYMNNKPKVNVTLE